MAPDAQPSNGSYGGSGSSPRAYSGPPPMSSPTPDRQPSPVQQELYTQSNIIERIGAEISRIEQFADTALRMEVDPPGSAAQVEKKPVDNVGTSAVARSINDRSNELAYILRRLTRIADRLEL